jgi:hypothetical protein
MSEELNISGNTDTDLKRKGRKPKQVNYFDVQEELAVVRFLTTESWDEKNKIYNDFLPCQSCRYRYTMTGRLSSCACENVAGCRDVVTFLHRRILLGSHFPLSGRMCVSFSVTPRLGTPRLCSWCLAFVSSRQTADARLAVRENFLDPSGRSMT